MWVSMVDYREEISIGKETLDRISEAYRKVRNTFRYLLSNLYDFEPDRHRVQDRDLEPIDQWAMQQLADLTRRVNEAYQRYEYHVVYHSLYRFWRRRNERLLPGCQQGSPVLRAPGKSERRSAQTALFAILDQLVRLAAPIFAFTAEEVWREIPSYQGRESSVHMSEFKR